MYTPEQYSELQAGYLETWTDEQLQTRKRELLFLLHALPEGDDDILLFTCQYHDVDEEEEVRAYYAEYPSPTRAEFKAIQQRINA